MKISIFLILILSIIINIHYSNAKASERYDYEKLQECIGECQNTDYILNLCYMGHPQKNVAKELSNRCLDYAVAYEKGEEDKYLSACYDVCKLNSIKK